MKNANQPINAILSPQKIIDYSNANPNMLGLTKREYFAAKAMQGLLGNVLIGGKVSEAANVAKMSIEYADALLKALEG